VVDADPLQKKKGPTHDDARGGALHRPRFRDVREDGEEGGGA
jgi:hypothetical protein